VTTGQEVLPVQMAWPQVQSMSGIFSIASHWALQYLPEVVMQEQTGCAHFLAVSFVILSLRGPASELGIQDGRVS
jgi:hypothetical protein